MVDGAVEWEDPDLVREGVQWVLGDSLDFLQDLSVQRRQRVVQFGGGTGEWEGIGIAVVVGEQHCMGFGGVLVIHMDGREGWCVGL